MLHLTLPHPHLHHFFLGTRVCKSPRALSALAAASACTTQPQSRELDEEDRPNQSDDQALAKIWTLFAKRTDLGSDLEDLRSSCEGGRLHLSERVVLDVLHRFGVDWRSALGFFRWAGATSPSNSTYKHGTCAYNKMVDLLGRAREFDRMWAMVREMRRGSLLVVDTFAKVVRRLVGGGRWEEAIRTFDGLEDMGLQKDGETLNLLLDALCKKKKVEVAYEMFQYHLPEIPPDAHTLNILVHGWCLIGRIDMAERMLIEMKRWELCPSGITYSTILQAHCLKLDFLKAFKLIDKMVDEGCPPNVVAYTSIVNSLAATGNIDDVCSIVKRMKSEGCKPDVFFYNTLISIFGRAGQLSKASHIFEVEMPENGVMPDLSTYNTLISVLCQHRQRDMALNVLRKVEDSSWKPDIHTFNPILKLCISAGYPDDILCDLLSSMVNKHHICLDSTTYSLLVRGLYRAGKCEAAYFVFEGMASRDILPMDVDLYDFLVEEAERKGLSDIVDWLKILKRKLKEFHHKSTS